MTAGFHSTLRMFRTPMSPITSKYYPILAGFGMPVNLVAIVILCRGECGLSKCITHYLVAMATADFMVIVFNVILHQIAAIYWWNSLLLYTPVCRFILFLSPTAIDISVWFTVAFTFDRFVAICCQKLKSKYCSVKTATAVTITLTLVFSLKNIPWAFLYIPYVIVNDIPRGCFVSPVIYFQSQAMAFSWIEQLLTPTLPFVLILCLNILTVRHILVASQARRNLRVHNSNAENGEDHEMKNRRRSIVLLFAISGSFILLWITTVTYFLYYRITSIYILSSLFSPYETYEKTGIMLQLLSCCTNTAIYAVTQSKFRQELLCALKYPFTLICK
ncbi:probable G-protein coupled receptor 139 isoform X2 [Stegostoma tigrinum]|uniref:probable G-protein coupled receptor 139 isoform X2 n=1 Tax=Stegostoma tigrinum TaxID=3053191 RepID=UPI0028702843|nr:probable G-protein coupled receptor 139 isoform X2 [Stegostoma tigrinum]